jgi:phosphoribosyl 1,2-cyclic phosphate phosphodiesterase
MAVASTSPISLLFLGTGTSAGVPMIGCHCEVCTSADPRDRRTRASVVISYDGVNVLVDTTPELRLQAVGNGVEQIDAIVYTHAHADHIMGLDDARRFNMIKDGPLDTWADAPTFESLSRSFGYAFKDPSDPLVGFRPHLVKRIITGPFEIGGRTWTPIPLTHFDQTILGFRIDSLAYCTDTSGISEASYALLAGVETLVIDALAWKPHPSHFSVEQAVDAARRIGAKRVWFTHMSHKLGHAATDAQLPENMKLSYDGLRINV